MAELVYTRDNILQRGEVASVAIYTRDDWQNPWVPQPTFKCNFLEHTVHGSIGKAEVFHNYGSISQTLGAQAHAAGWVQVAPIDVSGHWIRIDYTPTRIQTADPNTLTNTRDGMVVYNTTQARLERLTGGAWVPATDLSVVYSWYGVLVESRDDVFGADAALTGDTYYKAYSLEYLLAKKQIFESKMYQPGTPDTPRAIPRGLPFNGGRSDGRSSINNITGNRSPHLGTTQTPSGDPVFGFAETLKIDTSGGDTDDHNAIPWTIAEIIDYLLYFYAPTDANAATWAVSLSTEMRTYLQEFPFNDVETHGRTLLDIINQVFDRRRGFTWGIEVYEDDVDPQLDQFRIRVESYVATDLPLTGTGKVLPANSKQYFLDWTRNRDGKASQNFIQDTAQSYNKVVVTGARYGAVGTLQAGVQLSKDWTPAEESAYDTAASSNYGGVTSIATKERLNDGFREKSPINRVFTQYYLADSWSEEDYDGQSFFPDWSDLDDPIVGATKADGLWIAGLRIHNFVLLKEGWDYTVDPPVDNNQAGTVGDYMRCFGIGKIVTVDSSDALTLLDRRAEGVDDENLNKTSGLTVSCSITPLAEKPGLSVKPNGQPHLLNPDVFKIYDDAADSSNSAIAGRDRVAQIDGSEMYFTVYMTHDRIVSQEATVNASTTHNTNTTLYIQLGERARYDLLCPKTVVDINTSRQDAVLSPNAYVVLRDDRQWMKDLAICAAEWYSRERSAISVSHDQIIGDYLIGSLITTLAVTGTAPNVVGHQGNFVVGHQGNFVVGHGGAAVDINSIVSNVRHDFRNMTTSVKTQFTELDFRGLAG